MAEFFVFITFSKGQVSAVECINNSAALAVILFIAVMTVYFIYSRVGHLGISNRFLKVSLGKIPENIVLHPFQYFKVTYFANPKFATIVN